MKFVRGCARDSDERDYLVLCSDREEVYASNILTEQKRHGTSLDVLCGKYHSCYMDADGNIETFVAVSKEFNCTAFPEHGGTLLEKKKVGCRKWTA